MKGLGTLGRLGGVGGLGGKFSQGMKRRRFGVPKVARPVKSRLQKVAGTFKNAVQGAVLGGAGRGVAGDIGKTVKSVVQARYRRAKNKARGFK